MTVFLSKNEKKQNNNYNIYQSTLNMKVFFISIQASQSELASG